MLLFQYIVRGSCHIFIAGFDGMCMFLCRLHSEFTLQFSFEDVLQGRTLQMEKFDSSSQMLSALA